MQVLEVGSLGQIEQFPKCRNIAGGPGRQTRAATASGTEVNGGNFKELSVTVPPATWSLVCRLREGSQLADEETM